MSEYTEQLALLTDEEQAIYRQERIDGDDRARLAAIEAERVRLWNLERARRVGQDESAVPAEGWRVDRPNGWQAFHRDRSVGGHQVKLLLPKGDHDATY
jgi:hypothetical protein